MPLTGSNLDNMIGLAYARQIDNPLYNERMKLKSSETPKQARFYI